MTDSKCWKLATTEAIVKANELLCVYEDGSNDTYGGQSHVSRLDLASGKETLVGSFPGDMIVTNNAGALDPTAGKACSSCFCARNIIIPIIIIVR